MAKRKNITDRSIWYITTGHVKTILRTSKITGLTPYRAMGRRNTFYSIVEVIAEAQKRGIPVTEENIDKEMFSGGYPPYRKEKEVTTPTNDIPEEKVAEPLPVLNLTAYVDGSYNKITKVYGSAVVILDEEGNILLKKAFAGTKYNEMWQVAGELRAAIAAVTYAEELMADSLLIRYNDYEGIEKWATGEWTTKKEGSMLYSRFMTKERAMLISFEHVKAHTDNTYNEMVDDMAKEAAGVSEKDKPQFTGSVTLLTRETLQNSFQVRSECLDDIEAFKAKEKKAFGDYLKIRVHGTDGLSALKTAEEFSDILTEEEIAFLKANSEKSDYFLQACRWTVRGLRPEEAIRKVQVDAEIASKRS